jgi:large subunit ribosomal protein L25
MADATLTAIPRTETGNGPARRLRREGLVPGVLYQAPGPSIAFSVPERELRRALLAEGGREGTVHLTIGDAAPVTVRVADWDRDPVRGEFVHVDFAPADAE